MFRTAVSNPYDEAVAKATDENLTSEDWAAIMDLCDRVMSDDQGPKDVVQSIIKRLTHRNANVQLYTLEVANALSQNCGKTMHIEMSSRAFTDALLKLANDRNTHSQVKPKILERMKDWNDMFAGDSNLGIMKDAYFQLKQTNPTLEPPSAPQKNRLTDLDRQREEEDLQKALQLSLQDQEQRKTSHAGPSSSSGAAGSLAGPSRSNPNSTPASTQGSHAHVPVSSSHGTTAATVSRVRAIFDFVPSEEGELEFKKGDVIAVLESVYKDWWRGSLRGHTGIFPLNYVEKLTDPTPEEIQKEAQMEAEVFAEIRNVEKLLTLLSTLPNPDDNEEISKLYQRTTAIRPKLIKLIEKYSQKKDDFTQLNEKFIKARRDYEALLDASISHPPQHSYYGHPGQQPYRAPAGPPPAGYSVNPGPAQGVDPRYYNHQDPQQQQQQQQHHAPSQQYPVNTSSPAPNHYNHPSNSTPVPFFMAGVEVPAAPTPAPPQQSYAIRPVVPSASPPAVGGQSALITTSGTPSQNFQPYAQPTNSTRPQSTYGAQELATSVYDSPINPPAENPYAAAATSAIASGISAHRSSVSPPPPTTGAPPVPFTQPKPPYSKTFQPANPAVAGVPSMPTGAAPPIPGQAGGYRPYVPPGNTTGDSDADYYRTGY